MEKRVIGELVMIRVSIAGTGTYFITMEWKCKQLKHQAGKEFENTQNDGALLIGIRLIMIDQPCDMFKKFCFARIFHAPDFCFVVRHPRNGCDVV